jgi:hypothetical protein
MGVERRLWHPHRWCGQSSTKVVRAFRACVRTRFELAGWNDRAKSKPRRGEITLAQGVSTVSEEQGRRPIYGQAYVVASLPQGRTAFPPDPIPAVST